MNEFINKKNICEILNFFLLTLYFAKLAKSSQNSEKTKLDEVKLLVKKKNELHYLSNKNKINQVKKNQKELINSKYSIFDPPYNYTIETSKCISIDSFINIS